MERERRNKTTRLDGGRHPRCAHSFSCGLWGEKQKLKRVSEKKKVSLNDVREVLVFFFKKKGPCGLGDGKQLVAAAAAAAVRCLPLTLSNLRWGRTDSTLLQNE